MQSVIRFLLTVIECRQARLIILKIILNKTTIFYQQDDSLVDEVSYQNLTIILFKLVFESIVISLN